eukprot:PhM_4_TR18303/c0_g1_i1/m.48225
MAEVWVWVLVIAVPIFLLCIILVYWYRRHWLRKRQKVALRHPDDRSSRLSGGGFAGFPSGNNNNNNNKNTNNGVVDCTPDRMIPMAEESAGTAVPLTEVPSVVRTAMGTGFAIKPTTTSVTRQQQDVDYKTNNNKTDLLSDSVIDGEDEGERNDDDNNEDAAADLPTAAGSNEDVPLTDEALHLMAEIRELHNMQNGQRGNMTLFSTTNANTSSATSTTGAIRNNTNNFESTLSGGLDDTTGGEHSIVLRRRVSPRRKTEQDVEDGEMSDASGASSSEASSATSRSSKEQQQQGEERDKNDDSNDDSD